MKLLANKVHIQGMTVLLADKMHEQEPQSKWVHFTQPCIPTYLDFWKTSLEKL